MTSNPPGSSSDPPSTNPDPTGRRLEELVPSEFREFVAEAFARRVRLGMFVGLVAVAAAGIAMVLPSWYASQSTILPPTESADSFGMFSGLIENAALSRLGLFTSSTPSDVYAEILKSRMLRESLVRRFGLQKLYGQRTMDGALKELSLHVATNVSPAGVLTLRVEDREPKRASDMANFLVSELDRFNRESTNTRAKRTRQFLEQRLADVQERMRAAEEKLTRYEQANRVVATSDAAAVQAMASLIAGRLGLEVQRAYVSSYSRSGSGELRALDAQRSAYEKEIAKLPSLRNEGSRLALDAEIQRKVFALLTAQFEDARVQEMRDTPTLTVLDSARPAELRVRPRRAVLVLISAATAFALGLLWVWLTRPIARER